MCRSAGGVAAAGYLGSMRYAPTKQRARSAHRRGRVCCRWPCPLASRCSARGPPAPGWVVGESAVLLVLIVLVVRTAPARTALVAAVLAGVAAPFSLLRYGLGPPTVEALAGFAVWGLASALAATIGLYLRSLDDHRTRAVQEARREQRAPPRP